VSSPDQSSENRARTATVQPFAARLHFIPRVIIRYPQALLVRVLRRYFEQAPGWVLLTTQGRKTGLRREVLLPCERFHDGLYVISTYGRRSDWIRNLAKNPQVEVTCAGWATPALAEVIEAVETKQSIVSAHPFFPPLPLALLNFVHRTLLRPLTVAFLRWWVRSRPVVVIRPTPRL
jgi:deazaflavin-dependent oxidoreductase (nitroreductase family)